MGIYYFSILLFHFLINLLIIKCEDYVCKKNNDLANTKCFNTIIKFNSKKYRAPEFVTTKDGQLIIEYSEDATPR